MKYSLIIPVYNRPDEADELLESLTHQEEAPEFEVIIVEDGSTRPCREVVAKYEDCLTIHYYAKPNSGPGPSRNYGAERANGDWLIILDSDCVLPPGYLKAVETGIDGTFEAFGGPDAAHESFTDIQKAISYSMTSFFTTGGIRGGKKKMDRFHPRSYNMGIRRDVYSELSGFSTMRFGEDIDFSYRILEAGHQTRLLPEAWVWHKRRTDLDKFFKQVFNSGIARIHLEKRHPGTMKPVHALPAVFTIGVISLLLAAVALRLFTATTLWIWALMPLALFILLIFTDSSIRCRSAVIGFLSVEAAFVQLFGYGLGFIKAWWQRYIMHSGEFTAYEKNFYE